MMTTAIITPAQDQTYFAIVPQDLQTSSSLSSSSSSTSCTPVFPSNSSLPPSHRYLRLPHPRNDKPSLYLVYQPTVEGSDEVVLEVQSINPDKKRSWFYGEQVVGDGSLLLMTPINPLYLIIPLLISHVLNSTSLPSPTSLQTAIDREVQGERTDCFLPFDDLLDSLTRLDRCRLPRPFIPPPSQCGNNRTRGQVMRMDVEGEEEGDEMDLEIERMRMKPGRVGEEVEDEEEKEGNEDVARFCGVDCVQRTIKGLCETQDLADQTFYRPSLTSILESLRTKLQLLSHADTFQTLPSLQRTLTSIGLGPLVESAEDGAEGGSEVTVDIKVNVRRAEDERVLGLARTRVALDVMGQYLGSEVKQALMESYDFTPLDTYLETQEALSYAASRPITQSSGGGPGDEESIMDMLEGKDGRVKGGPLGSGTALKRKTSEKGSRAVEALKKVNTSKMPKLTTFFQKKK